jgi:hypothetical protein
VSSTTSFGWPKEAKDAEEELGMVMMVSKSLNDQKLEPHGTTLAE